MVRSLPPVSWIHRKASRRRSTSQRSTCSAMSVPPRVAVAELGQCGGACLLVEDEAGDVLQVGSLLGGRAVHDGLQFHGDERARLGDQGADLDWRAAGDAEMMVTSVAVSMAQAWADACRRSPGSSLGWSISICRTSSTSTLTLPYTVGSSTDVGSTGSAPWAERSTWSCGVAPSSRSTTSRSVVARYGLDRRHMTASPPTTTGGWPSNVRTSSTACTTAAIASPMNVTRLPDTRPPLRGSPVSKDLPPAACVLG